MGKTGLTSDAAVAADAAFALKLPPVNFACRKLTPNPPHFNRPRADENCCGNLKHRRDFARRPRPHDLVRAAQPLTHPVRARFRTVLAFRPEIR
ncbi:MAG TPA: hypothetical protein VF588_17725 [Pyrinomonadaceae bacterium]|jgi:hypothetical protein